MTDRYPCRGCEWRTAEPNCHDTCCQYLMAKEKADEVREKMQKEHQIDNDATDAKISGMRRMRCIRRKR